MLEEDDYDPFGEGEDDANYSDQDFEASSPSPATKKQAAAIPPNQLQSLGGESGYDELPFNRDSISQAARPEPNTTVVEPEEISRA